MTITALPTPPLRSDPTNFASRADTFLAALPTFADEANALAAAMNLNATTDVSTSSITIGTGSKTFTVSAGKSWQVGMYLLIADTALPSTNSMSGQVLSYSSTTLVVDVQDYRGGGSISAWTISQSGVYATVANATHAATSKSTPVDADELPIADSTASFVLKKLTWANLKATLLTWLQGTVFPSPGAIGGTTPAAGSFTTLAASGSTTLGGATSTGIGNGEIGFNNSTALRWRNVANNAYLNAMYVDASNNQILGGSAVNSIVASVVGAGVIGNFSPTGLAVTGALSATGRLTTAGLTEDASGNLGLGVTPSAWASYKTIDIGTNGAGFSGGTESLSVSTNAYFNAGVWKYKGTTSSNATRYNQYGGAHSWYTAPSGTADAAITFTQALAVGHGTTLALEGATSAAGTGIAFPATQVASSNANTLDDYEEGTFAPTVVGTTTAGVGTYNLQAGRYTKIGRVVHFQIWVNMTAHTGTGNMLIGALPFTSSSGSGVYASCVIGSIGNLTLPASSFPVGYITNGSTQIILNSRSTAGGNVVDAALALDVAFAINISGSYILD